MPVSLRNHAHHAAEVDQHREQRQHPQRRARRRGRASRPTGRRTPGGPPRRQRRRPGVSSRERGEPVDARPLHRAAEPEQHAGAEAPPAHAEPRARRGSRRPGPRRARRPCARARRRGRRPGVAKAATTNNAAKASSMPIRDWTCDSPSQISSTPATPPSSVDRVSRRRDPDHEQHGHRAGQRGRGAPAPAVVAEQPLADRDELLAQRRVHDELVAGVVLDAAVAQHLPGLRRRSASRRRPGCRRPWAGPAR